jgi:hypothetical protein
VAAQTINFSVTDTTTGVGVSPAAATVQAGQYATTSPPATTITLSSPTATGTYTVNVTSNGFANDPATVTVTVNLPSITALNNGSDLTVGMRMQTAFPGQQTGFVNISLDTPAPAGGLTVSLQSQSSSVASVDQTVVIPEKSTSGTFVVRGVALGTTQISATASGWISPKTLKVTVVTPTLQLFDRTFGGGVQTTRTVGGVPDSIGAQFCVPNVGCGTDSLVAAQTINFSVTDTTTGVVVSPATATVQADQYATTSPPATTITLSSPTGTGSYTLNVTTGGFATDPAAVNVTVN